MAKHRGSSDEAFSTTDAGKNWNELTAEEKAEEFEASERDPRGYAHRNFHTTTDTQYTQARHAQRAAQEETRRQS